MEQLTSMEFSMIKTMMPKSGNLNIAKALDIELEQVNIAVQQIYRETGIEPRQFHMDEWKANIKKAQELRKKERTEEKIKKLAAKKTEKLQVQQDREQKKLLPKVKVAPVRSVKEKPVKQSREADLYHAQRKKEYDRKKFATIDVNLDQMQSVRIDDKTTIFIKPGEDVAEARLHYLRREGDKKNNIYSKKN